MGWFEFIVAIWASLMQVFSAAVWPVALLVAAWWARPLLSKLGVAIGQFIATRDFRVKVGNIVEASMGAPVMQQSVPPTTPSDFRDLALSASAPLAPSDRPLVTHFEGEVIQQLSQIESGNKLEVLARWYAELRALASHEIVFNRIWASQIGLLTKLNQTGSMSHSEVQRHFNMVVEAYPEGYPIAASDAWFGFLTENSLAAWQDDALHITDVGKDFLVYLVQAGLNPLARSW
jgi:hypothetical protein